MPTWLRGRCIEVLWRHHGGGRLKDVGPRHLDHHAEQRSESTSFRCCTPANRTTGGVCSPPTAPRCSPRSRCTCSSSRRSTRRIRRMHLFLACPMGVAVLLGNRWNRLCQTVVYEDIKIDSAYEAAFTMEA
ncbi:SAVED domain-containing protein [Streptomyces sp. NPDC001851]|uniref:SAVED domain-containing protein n=1 Tax=Streptomyces sp. NPDC001851 TaxID=3154529 RepID=UPI0033234CD4